MKAVVNPNYSSSTVNATKSRTSDIGHMSSMISSGGATVGTNTNTTDKTEHTQQTSLQRHGGTQSRNTDINSTNINDNITVMSDGGMSSENVLRHLSNSTNNNTHAEIQIQMQQTHIQPQTATYAHKNLSPPPDFDQNKIKRESV